MFVLSKTSAVLKLPGGSGLKRALASAAAISALILVSACSNTTPTAGLASAINEPLEVNYAFAYAPMEDSEVALPGFQYEKMRKRYLRQTVDYRGDQKSGTIVIDTTGPFLYLIQPGGKALRYGIAVGREGFEWAGDAQVKWKQKWPTWTPPAEMIERSPKLAEFEDGMPAGIENPLGARALYLFKDGKDTMYRIHGTNRPFSIGNKASSGCFRMINQDVIDLYARVQPGANVFVRHGVPDFYERGV